MKTRFHSFCATAAVAVTLGLISLSTAAAQTQIRIDVEAPGSVALAPSWVQFSSTSNAVVQGGATASAGLELLAELGDTSGLIGERGGQQISGPLGTPGGPTSNSTVVTVNDSDNWFNFAAMILPSNDWFVGTGGVVPELDITSLLFGATTGTSVSLNFTDFYDAGTEEEDFNFAAPPGSFGLADPTLSSPPGGNPDSINTVRLISGAGNPFSELANPFGDISSLATNGNPVATVTLTVVPEPGSLVGLLAIGGLGMLRRRR